MLDDYAAWRDENPVKSTVGYFVPGVGTAMSGADAAHSFGKGDILSGLGHSALAAVSLIPGGGILGAAAKGIGRLAGAGSRVARGTAAVGKAMTGAGNALGMGSLKRSIPATVGGVAALSLGGEKQAFLQGLQDTWNGLDGNHKAILGFGGGLLGASLMQSIADKGELGPLMGLAGAGAMGYGMSGGKFSNLLPNLKRSVGFPATQAGQTGQQSLTGSGGGGASTATSPSRGVSNRNGLDLAAAAKDPRMSRFFGPDGSPRMQEVMKASDDDLRGGLNLLSPDARTQLHQQVTSFKPSFAQSLGAKALGIDVEGQRKRMLGLLG